MAKEIQDAAKLREVEKHKHEKKLAREIQGATKAMEEDKKRQATKLNNKDQKHERQCGELEKNRGQVR